MATLDVKVQIDFEDTMRRWLSETVRQSLKMMRRWFEYERRRKKVVARVSHDYERSKRADAWREHQAEWLRDHQGVSTYRARKVRALRRG